MKIKKTVGDDGKTIGFKVERTPVEQEAFDARKKAEEAKRKEEGDKAVAAHQADVKRRADARAPIERAVKSCVNAKDPAEFLATAPGLARVLDRVTDLELRGLKKAYDEAVTESAYMLPEQQRAMEEIGERMRQITQGDARAMPIREMRRMIVSEDQITKPSAKPIELPPAPSRTETPPPTPPVSVPPKPRTLGEEIDDIPRALRQIWKDLWKK